jgi:hypothetical protein
MLCQSTRKFGTRLQVSCAWLVSVPGLLHYTCVSSIACVAACLCLRTKQGTSGALFSVRHKDGIVPT